MWIQWVLFFTLSFLAVGKASCLPGTSLLQILDSINEHDDPQKISTIIDNNFICCNSPSYIVIEKAVTLNRSESLNVILESTLMMSENEKVSLIECAIHAHAAESLIVMFQHGFVYRNRTENRQRVSMRRALWCGSCGWTASEIERLSMYQGFYALIGDYKPLFSIKSDDIACLFCRLLLENQLKSPESILWLIASNKHRHLDDHGLSEVIRLLLSHPFRTPRNLWISNQLLWQFLRTHLDAFESMTLIMEDPRILLNRASSLPHSTSSVFLRRFGNFIQLCKSGEHVPLRQILGRAKLSSRALEVMLRSAIKCKQPLCFKETLIHFSRMLISNRHKADGNDHELVSLAESGLQKMILMHKMSLEQAIPGDITMYINQIILQLTLDQIYSTKI